MDVAPLTMVPCNEPKVTKPDKLPVRRTKNLPAGNVSKTSDSFSNPRSEKEKFDTDKRIRKLVGRTLDVGSHLNIPGITRPLAQIRPPAKVPESEPERDIEKTDEVESEADKNDEQ